MNSYTQISLDAVNEGELISLYEHTSDLSGILPKDRYTNDEFLAEGAIKKVYKVTDTHCDRDVAFARIKPELIDWQQSVEFIQEVQLTSSFEHPHIIRVYDLGILDEAPWFTMELTSGLTLNDWVKQQELSLNQKLKIISNICDAVAYAHERNVLHLDLKPDNISIGIHGQVLVADWGLAIWSLNQSAENNAEIKHIKGTPGYMAPEQARGDSPPSVQTDIFSIGALFYFILTGESPIVGDTPQVRLTSTINTRLKDLTHPSIPSRVAPIIRKCLNPYPANRYASVFELSADIERFQGGFATEAGPDSLKNISTLFFQRHKTACILTLSLVTTAVIAASTYLHQIRKSKAIAEFERQKALTLVDELRQKEQEMTWRNEQHAMDLLSKSITALREGHIKKAYIAAELAHRLFPSKKQISAQFGLISFLNQDFVNAEKYLPSDDEKARTELLRRLAKKHNQASFDKSFDAIPSTFKTICAKSGIRLTSHFFIYDAKFGDKNRHAQLVETLIAHYNRIPEMQFTWNPKTRVLDLSGNPQLRTLLVEGTRHFPSYNIIDGLPVARLVLDDTPHNRANGSNFLPDELGELHFK